MDKHLDPFKPAVVNRTGSLLAGVKQLEREAGHPFTSSDYERWAVLPLFLCIGGVLFR